MPIYEFACPKCRVIFSFLSKRLNPEGDPKCPKCGNEKMSKQMSSFAMIKGGGKGDNEGTDGGPDMSGVDESKMMRAMGELEKDMAHLDENNPRHMAHLMRKMQQVMPEGVLPKEMDIAIKRLEAGEDPDKIEEDMGDILGDVMGDMDGGPGGGMGGFSQDPGLYDY
jgi:putative FmdB family regulatory protein